MVRISLKAFKITYDGIPSFFRFNKSATGDPYYAMAGFNGTFESMYIQDKYYVSDILTINYGLRYDSFEMSYRTSL